MSIVFQLQVLNIFSSGCQLTAQTSRFGQFFTQNNVHCKCFGGKLDCCGERICQICQNILWQTPNNGIKTSVYWLEKFREEQRITHGERFGESRPKHLANSDCGVVMESKLGLLDKTTSVVQLSSSKNTLNAILRSWRELGRSSFRQGVFGLTQLYSRYQWRDWSPRSWYLLLV